MMGWGTMLYILILEGKNMKHLIVCFETEGSTKKIENQKKKKDWDGKIN